MPEPVGVHSDPHRQSQRQDLVDLGRVSAPSLYEIPASTLDSIFLCSFMHTCNPSNDQPIQHSNPNRTELPLALSAMHVRPLIRNFLKKELEHEILAEGDMNEMPHAGPPARRRISSFRRRFTK